MDNVLDAIIAQSILFERYKMHVEQMAVVHSQNTRDEIVKVLQRLSVSKLSDLRKMQYNALNKKINNVFMEQADAFAQAFEDETRRFVRVEVPLFGALLASYLTPEQTKSLYGVSLFTQNKTDEVIAAIRAQMIAAVGLMWADLQAQTQFGQARLLSQKLNRNRADKLTVQDMVKTISTQDPTTGGASFTQTVRNDGKTLIATLLAHAQSVIAAGIMSIFVSRYEWISVLDSRTTDICRSRDGNVYEYGNGPIPPAHYNCRSRIAPLLARQKPSEDVKLDIWLKRQDPTYLRAAFGRKTADAILDGSISLDKITALIDNKPLTLPDYQRLAKQFTMKG